MYVLSLLYQLWPDKMPAALKNLIDLGYTDGGTAFSDLLNARNHLYWAGDNIAAENWAEAKNELYNAADDFGLFGKYLLQDDVWYESFRRDWRDALYWINDNWPENGEPPPPYELTARKICQAWAVNEFEERALTIAFIDRMRQLVWDEPFYVAWAARPIVQWV